MDIDDVYGTIGEFGALQVKIFFATGTLSIFFTFQMIHTVFIGAEPLVDCVNGKSTIAGCPTEGQICKSYSYARSNFTSIATEWDLVCGERWRIGLVQSLFMAGVLFGALIFGMMSDRFGRRPTLLVSVTGTSIFAFVAAFVSSYDVYAALRTVTGMCTGGAILVSFVLTTEVIGSSKRSLIGAVFPTLFGGGIALFALMAYWIPFWRHLSVVCALPGFGFALLYYCLLPESPRWHLSQGRAKEAADILRNMARRNNYKGVLDFRLKQAEGDAGATRTYGMRDVLCHPVLRGRTFIQIFAWFVLSLVYYGLTMSSQNLGSNLYISAALSGLVELPAYAALYFLVDRIGRRISFYSSMIIGGGSCMAILIYPGTALTTMWLALVGKLSISLSFAVAYIYAAELYPTVVRNNAMGLCSMAARVGGIAAPMVAPLGSFYPNLQYLVFGSLSFVAGVLAWKLPETANQPMLETMEDLHRKESREVVIPSPDKIRLMEGDIRVKEKELIQV